MDEVLTPFPPSSTLRRNYSNTDSIASMVPHNESVEFDPLGQRLVDLPRDEVDFDIISITGSGENKVVSESGYLQMLPHT